MSSANYWESIERRVGRWRRPRRFIEAGVRAACGGENEFMVETAISGAPSLEGRVAFVTDAAGGIGSENVQLIAADWPRPGLTLPHQARTRKSRETN